MYEIVTTEVRDSSALHKIEDCYGFVAEQDGILRVYFISDYGKIMSFSNDGELQEWWCPESETIEGLCDDQELDLRRIFESPNDFKITVKF